MNNTIYLIGEVGYDITLESVMNDVKMSNKDEPLHVHIHSVGGSVFDGLAIYNYLKDLHQEVITHTSGIVASIASVIYLAGNTRRMNSTDNYLIHLPSGFSEGNAVDFEKTAKQLRGIEDSLATIYENETDLTKEEALELMRKDDFLDTKFLLEKKFINELILYKAVAKFNNNHDMNLTKEDKGWFENMFTKLGQALKPVKIENKIVQDANGVEIDFIDLEEDATPKVGDKANVDGSAASGEYVMPSGDTYVFEDGALSEIKTDAGDDEDMEALKQENEQLKQQLADANASLDTATASLTEAEKVKNTVKKDFEELKAKVTSSFEWAGKEPENKGGNEESKKRKLFKEKA